MATIFFDFDSTLIKIETLERILEDKLKDQPEKKEKIKEITEAGMRGKISFNTSFKERLTLATPSRLDAELMGEKALNWITSGMEELISSLKRHQVDLWIVSGALKESVLPVGVHLGIEKDHILGVSLLWDRNGEYAGIDSTDPFSRSKVEGLRERSKEWQSPIIGIGDAMSDYRLLEEGIIERFILYTEHFRCKELMEKGLTMAENAYQLQLILEKELKCSL